MRIKLVTWNLHRCIGRDGVMSAQRCAAVLKAIDADIIALQEVESRPGHELDALAYLAGETDNRIIPGTTMIDGEQHYGNAVLTHLPVLQARSHDLSVDRREPRAVLDVCLQVEQCRMQLLATHLGLKPVERREQVQRLLGLVEIGRHDLTVLAGDLNEWFVWGRPLRRLHGIFPAMPHRRTWPAHLPLFALDRVWVQPATALHSLYTHRAMPAPMASDHLPLVALIDIPSVPLRRDSRHTPDLR
jgi:endonuclease/exonuclease/phosphatase family metal-dependent hydrolase